MQRLNLILLAVVATLGIVIALLPNEVPPADPGTPITTLTRSAIERIVVQRKDQKDDLRFVKKAGQWQIESSPQLPLNQTRIDNLLALSQATAQKHFPADTNNLSKYGLSEPRFMVTFNDIVLAFGHTDPIHQKRYIKQGGIIYLIDDRYSHLLADPAMAYVSASLLPANSHPIKLELPDFSLQKGKQDWQVTPAPTSQISQDDLLGVVEEWRYASALQVKALDKSLHDKGKTIRITLETQSQPIQFNAIKTKDEWILQRLDLGIQYHFTDSTAENLLNYQPPPTAD